MKCPGQSPGIFASAVTLAPALRACAPTNAFSVRALTEGPITDSKNGIPAFAGMTKRAKNDETVGLCLIQQQRVDAFVVELADDLAMLQRFADQAAKQHVDAMAV